MRRNRLKNVSGQQRTRRQLLENATTSAVEVLENRTLLSTTVVQTGFAGWSLNGVAAVSPDNTDLTITTSAGGEANSAWNATAVSYQNFTASFKYQETLPVGGGADGITFTLQNDTRGVNAVGGGGGNIGYSGITPSFAVDLNIYNGFKVGDNFNGGGNQNAITTAPVDGRTGDIIDTTIQYDGIKHEVFVNMKDETTSATFYDTFYNVNLGNQLGANTALIGFTGGTGGAWAQQDITNFVYSTNTTPPPPPGQISGFGASSGAGQATLNSTPTGVPSISTDSNSLTLTTAAANEASSAFFPVADSYHNFTASFTYQESGGTTPPANGFTFTIEDDSRGASALGGSGTDLGYANAANPTATKISPSVALEFNINGVSAISVASGGTNTVSTSTSNTGSVNLASGDKIDVSLNFDASTLTATLTDEVTHATYTTVFNSANIAGALGAATGYVGFTGSTDGGDAQQVISNFLYTPNTAVPPAPTNGPVNNFSSPMTFNSGGTTVAGVPGVSADGATLTITTAANNQANSAFFNTPVTFQNFVAKFTYTDVTKGGADGVAFVLQNSAADVNALGGTGGALGYGGITPSFAVELNCYQVSSTADTTNGATNQPHSVANTGTVDITNGDPINVTLAYNSAQFTLVETLTDATTNATYSTIYSDINLPSILGASTAAGTTNNAFLGFTGGTGGANATQTISNFSYTTNPTGAAAIFPTLPAGVNSVSGFANEFYNDSSNNPGGVPGLSADGNTLTLTTAANNETSVALNSTPVNYGDFHATFTYTGSGAADGVGFVLEAQPGLNQGGGQIGFGPALPDSFAVEFNIYQNNSTAIGAGGTIDLPYTPNGNTGGVQLTTGNPTTVDLKYSSSAQTLTETLTDTVTAATYTTTYNNVNIAQYMGNSPSAYVGFCAGTGGANALQTVDSFTYTADNVMPAASTASQVNLTGYYQGYGIGTPGQPVIGTGNPNGGQFAVPGGGTTGYDGGGNQLDGSLVPATVTVTANGNTQTFNLGPAASTGYPDVVVSVGQTINLPQGHYGNISLLGSAADGTQLNQPVSVNYTDGTSQTFSQSFSDWWAPATTQPGETIALSMPDHLDNAGNTGTQGAGQNIDIYEYQFAPNPAKTVSSITLPVNQNVKVMAINVNAAPAVTSISPTSGPAAGGTTVTINGTGFTGATAVDFGSTPASAFTVNSAGTQITATDPAGSGTVDVTVTGPFGTSPTSAADKFTYQSNTQAPTLVGKPVINGDNPNGLFTAAGQPANGAQRSMVEDIVYTFNEPVVINNANQAFTVAVAGSRGTAPATLFAQAVSGSNGTQWAVSVSGKAEGTLASIANGEYSIKINPQFVFAASDGTTQMASGETDTFYRLFGDINGDRVVNAIDNAKLKTALTTYNSAFDSNGDGFVNAFDNAQFKNSQSISFLNDGFVTTI